MKPKRYLINEIFYSIQGEGILAGTPMVFIRFAKCNMKCRMEKREDSPGGFDCDTEFESGVRMTLDEILETIVEITPSTVSGDWLLLTGGEPALQLDKDFIEYFRNERGFRLAIETNGSVELPINHVSEFTRGRGQFGDTSKVLSDYSLDHICVSPKVAEHCIQQLYAHEVKYVRGYKMAIPKTRIEAEHYLISPATNGLDFDQQTVDWCVELVKNNPSWKLTAQLHKLWRAR